MRARLVHPRSVTAISGFLETLNVVHAHGPSGHARRRPVV